jgi:hypothetical protein
MYGSTQDFPFAFPKCFGHFNKKEFASYHEEDKSFHMKRDNFIEARDHLFPLVGPLIPRSKDIILL